MAHQLQHITDLAELLFAHHVEDVVISPGSRNAPLIRAFYNRFGQKCTSLVDERSAAYFALGQSMITGKPTVLISTSGTAVLNYAPAIAEAFYQEIPLLIITADRPREWIGQQDNQAIRQEGIYNNFIKACYSLPVDSINPDDLWLAHRIANEAFYRAVSPVRGPVHINVPLREPLYENLPQPSNPLKRVRKIMPESEIKIDARFQEEWDKAKSILVVCGQFLPNEKLKADLQKLSTDFRVVIIAEPVSNLHEAATISNPEVVYNSKINYPDVAIPDLVLYFGGQLVSKKVKLFLRRIKSSTFCFISPGEEIVDTFQNVNFHVQVEPVSVVKALTPKVEEKNSPFKKFWQEENARVTRTATQFIDTISFSDLFVFKRISETLPESAVVFAGNSSAVRYLLYFDQKDRRYYSNRGVSGIDGCLSSAVGIASKVDEPVFAIIGDLSLVYNSNALWNRDLPENLKIIVVNNEGGGIFHLLKGPSEHEAFEPLVNAHHPVNFQKLAEAFGIEYISCDSAQTIDICLSELNKFGSAAVLEIRTSNHGEPQITKDFFNFLNKNYEAQMDHN